MKRFIVINVILAAWCSQYVSAQQAEHEFSAYLGSGLSTLNYQLAMGSRNAGVGGNLGVGYTYFRGKERVTGTGKIVREDWGLHTGLEFGLYNAKSKIINEKTLTKGLYDIDRDIFDLHTTLDNYREKQNMLLLSIPMMAQFTLDRYYVLGGFKLGIPIMSKYKSKDATLTNWAHYVEVDGEEFDNWAKTQNFAGYGTFNGLKSDGRMKFGASAMLSFEAGAKWRLRRKLSLYSGVYFDYGLNNFAKKNQNNFVNPFNYRGGETSFTTNSVLSVYTEKIKVMAVGVKVRMAMTR